MRNKIEKFSKVVGAYYPENPARNPLAYHKRIDFILEDYFSETPKIRKIGGGQLEKEDIEQIALHIRKAIAGFLANPKRENYPVLIREIK